MPKKIKLSLRTAGVCLSSAVMGESVPIETGGFHSSSEGETFFRILESLTGEFLSAVAISPSHVDNLLVIVNQANEATIYLNEIRPTLLVQSKVSTTAGQPVNKTDLADIRELDLGIEIPKDCGFLYIFSVGWRKGLLFDFSPTQPGVIRNFDLNRALGASFAFVLASERFALNDVEWEQLIAKGWFPFIGLNDQTVHRMIDFLRTDIEIDKLLPEIVSQIEMIGRSATDLAQKNPDFKAHSGFIQIALERFLESDCISAGSVLYPRIEGMLRTFYKLSSATAKPGQATLLSTAFPPEFATRSATSLLRNDRFVTYLERVIFAGFDWDNPAGVSRHTVGHGVVNQNDLSEKSILLAFLTVHHLLFALMSRRIDVGAEAKP
ncbi:hypothetical protein [Granulicella sp. L60]|uniref:hypothetical protein n=1 Tax=Granulicella sp. L60 TaxID=1641866 RepID=UPI00131EB0C2|nr:hypothetical protein [Granulicella sp. L60]